MELDRQGRLKGKGRERKGKGKGKGKGKEGEREKKGKENWSGVVRARGRMNGRIGKVGFKPIGAWGKIPQLLKDKRR